MSARWLSVERAPLSALMFMLALIAAAAGLGAVQASTERGAKHGGLPVGEIPQSCTVDYLLAPGERAVFTCTLRGGGAPVVTSNHDHVDAHLLRATFVLERGVRFSLVNASATPVQGRAFVQVF